MHHRISTNFIPVKTCSAGSRRRLVRMGLLALLMGLAVLNRAQAEMSPLTNQWSVLLRNPLGNVSDSSPAVAPDGTIYFGTFQGDLYALNQNGSRKWIFHAGREIKCSPAIGSDGAVYFGSRDRKFYALTPNGQEKWEFKTGAWVDSSPAVSADDTVYFGSWDKNFYAVSAVGAQKWQFQTGGEIECSPAIGSDGTVYFGSHDHKFYALAPDGNKLWEYNTGAPVVSSPAIDKDGSIYFTSVNGTFYALKAEGTLKWQLETGGITEASPVIGQDGMIIIGVNKELWAISSEGKREWHKPAELPIRAAALALSDNSLCYVATDGYLLSICRPDKCNWFFQLGYGAVAPAMGVDRAILAPGLVLNVGAEFYGLPNAVPLARSSWPKFRGNLQNTGRKND